MNIELNNVHQNIIKDQEKIIMQLRAEINRLNKQKKEVPKCKCWVCRIFG